MAPEPYFEIDPDPETAKRIRKERDKARALKRTPWWKQQLHKGRCHYCGNPFQPDQLSMDHVVPLARGGKSTKGNIVPACQSSAIEKRSWKHRRKPLLRKLSED